MANVPRHIYEFIFIYLLFIHIWSCSKLRPTSGGTMPSADLLFYFQVPPGTRETDLQCGWKLLKTWSWTVSVLWTSLGRTVGCLPGWPHTASPLACASSAVCCHKHISQSSYHWSRQFGCPTTWRCWYFLQQLNFHNIYIYISFYHDTSIHHVYKYL